MSVSKVTFYHLASCKGLCIAKKWSKNRLEQCYQPVYMKVSGKEVQTAVFLEILYSPSISLLSSFPLALFFSSLNKSETPLANSVSFQLWSQCANLLFQIAPHLLKHDRYSTSTVHRNARKSHHKFFYTGKNSVIFVTFYAKNT